MMVEQRVERAKRRVIGGLALLIVLIALAVLAAGCSQVQRETTAPTAEAPVQVAQQTATVTPPAADPAPPSDPPVAADPPANQSPTTPAVPAKPFDLRHCDTSKLGAVRCYNPSDEPVVASAAVGPFQNCAAPWAGVHENVRIAARTNGYFTLPGPACNQHFQLDLYYGPRVGECRAPDATGQSSGYRGDICAPEEPKKPVCEEPPWGPWIDVLPQEVSSVHPFEEQPCTRTKTQIRYRIGCDGKQQHDTRTVSACPAK